MLIARLQKKWDLHLTYGLDIWETTSLLLHNNHGHHHFSCWKYKTRNKNIIQTSHKTSFQAITLCQCNLTDLPIRYSPRGKVPLTHSRTPALGVKGTTYLVNNNAAITICTRTYKHQNFFFPLCIGMCNWRENQENSITICQSQILLV